MLSQEALFQDYPLLKSPTDQSDAYLILEEEPDQEIINGINCVKATLKVVNPDEGEVAMTVWYAPSPY